MGYSKDLLEQLNFGKGQTLYGDTPLAILKAYLESGVSYISIAQAMKPQQHRCSLLLLATP